MAKEEFLDAVIYIIADYLRTKGESFLQDDEPDDNKRIMSIVDDWENIDSPQHKMLLWNMFNMLNKISTQGKWHLLNRNKKNLLFSLGDAF